MPTIEEVTAKPIKPTKEEPTTTTSAPRFLPLETIPVRLEGPSVSSNSPVFGVISNMSRVGGVRQSPTLSLPKDAAVRLTIAGGRAKHMNVATRVVWCAEGLEPAKEIVGYLTGLTFPNRFRKDRSRAVVERHFSVDPVAAPFGSQADLVPVSACVPVPDSKKPSSDPIEAQCDIVAIPVKTVRNRDESGVGPRTRARARGLTCESAWGA